MKPAIYCQVFENIARYSSLHECKYLKMQESVPLTRERIEICDDFKIFIL